MFVSGRRYLYLLFICLTVLSGCKSQAIKENFAPEVSYADSYISVPPSQSHFISLLVSGDYLTLELELDGYYQAYLDNPMNDQALDWAYSSFEVDNLEFLKFLDLWVKNSPKNYYPYLARGIYFTHMGGLSRGTRYANETSKEQFFQMEKYFENALADFEKTESIREHLLPEYCAKSYIYRASRRELSRSEQKANLIAYADGMLKAHPYSSVIRHCFMTSLLPRWHGSYPEMISQAKRTKSRWNINPKLKSLYFRVPIDKAEMEVSIGRFSKALEILDKVLEYGNDAGVLAAKGDVYMRLRDDEKAIQFYELSLKQDLYNSKVSSVFTPLVYKVAIDEFQANRYDQARGMLDKILFINSTDHYALLLYGRSFMLEQRFNDSVGYLKQSIDANPFFQPAWQYLLASLAQIGDEAGLTEYCLQAAVVFPSVECPKIDIRS
ncbi:tetratricopeptide repeat protein [Litoribrevibacter albus]|uniref:Tetratricopeptide repeat protein n=1 Tax=Litoribrevibacter albus TaxID=1473156 RepID=A0AA37S631_9GAMM|nr:tetratricopeptide repeat protein [Litoribrevibacter albus]GLQ29901.1 hypothetical protein GCM10007876_03790 [Litoribrevibacter albus]